MILLKQPYIDMLKLMFFFIGLKLIAMATYLFSIANQEAFIIIIIIMSTHPVED